MNEEEIKEEEREFSVSQNPIPADDCVRAVIWYASLTQHVSQIGDHRPKNKYLHFFTSVRAFAVKEIWKGWSFMNIKHCFAQRPLREDGSAQEPDASMMQCYWQKKTTVKNTYSRCIFIPGQRISSLLPCPLICGHNRDTTQSFSRDSSDVYKQICTPLTEQDPDISSIPY